MQQSQVIEDLCLWKTRAGKSHDYRDVTISKTSVFKMFSRPCKKKTKLAFSNSSDLKSVFEKLRFHDGLVWTVGLTVEIKLRFQITPA